MKRMTADEYRNKWASLSHYALAKAVAAGEDVQRAAQRIHRRYHRAVAVSDLLEGAGWHRGQLALYRLAMAQQQRYTLAPGLAQALGISQTGWLRG